MSEAIKPGYLRVSSIIGQWHQFDMVDPAVLLAKCHTGTRVHEAIAGGVHHSELTPSEKHYYFSYIRWSTQVEFEIVEQELRMYCDKLKITGCCDAIMKMGNELCIVDFKTSASESPKTWPLQGCFYRYLAVQNGYAGLSNRLLFLKLDPKGLLPKVYEYEYTSDLMNICMSALNCYRYMNS